jgi:hypothetical protein
MNTAAPSIPSIKSLYHRDNIIGRSLRTMGFALFAAAGFKWASQPVNSVVEVENSPIEIWVMHWGPTVAVVVAALAAIVLVRRFLWVKQVLSTGTTISGTVEDIDLYEREASHSDSTPAFQRSIIRTYVVDIRYAWNGVEKQARLKLPLSPFTYNISKGGKVDLLVHESAPDKPLISIVYLGRF